MINVSMKGKGIHALLDTGVSESYIDFTVATMLGIRGVVRYRLESLCMRI